MGKSTLRETDGAMNKRKEVVIYYHCLNRLPRNRIFTISNVAFSMASSCLHCWLCL